MFDYLTKWNASMSKTEKGREPNKKGNINRHAQKRIESKQMDKNLCRKVISNAHPVISNAHLVEKWFPGEVVVRYCGSHLASTRSHQPFTFKHADSTTHGYDENESLLSRG